MASLSDEIRVGRMVLDHLAAAGIDESDPDFAALVDTECDVLERLRRVLRAARVAGAQAGALGGLVAEMRERSARLGRKEDRLRALAAGALSELGLTRLDAPDFTASLRPGKPGLVGEPVPEALPDRLCKITRTVDRAALRAALEAGETIEGVALGNAPPVLTLRTR